jgi:ubiquinone/menaquinone biosynthesis C-methylase UbiE
MGFYRDWIVPALIDLSMRNRLLLPYRQRVAGAAEGRVLEIGIGSGLNLPFYAQRARQVFGIDPSPALLERTRRQAQRIAAEVQLLNGSAEHIPLANHSIDIVLTTWTACSIPDAAAAFGEMRRVLRPGGASCSSSTAAHRRRVSHAGRIASRRHGARSAVDAISTARSTT